MIVLLSDFQQSEYAGVVKGVIHTHNPQAKIIDLNNAILPQNIRQGAWVLKTTYGFFPKKTIFLCVIDPGVGGARKNIAIETQHYWFVGPNNGLMSVSAIEDTIKNVYLIHPSAQWKVSNTFHGRDIYAHIAAQLDKGSKANLKKISIQELAPLEFHKQAREGEIVNLDGYGNIVTNIPANNQHKYKISYDGLNAEVDFHPNYDHAKENQLFLVTGSNGTLEFSVKNASALEKFEIILAKPIIGKKIKIE